MQKFFNKFFSICLLVLTLSTFPIKSMANNIADFNQTIILAQQNIINYEKSQPSAIDNPVVDPNFNVMRSSDMNSSSATYFVIALVILAAIVPLASWFFSKSRASQ
tara:strand:+ start:416 stop:733 length:318 start_codon:yes stop_codon:yes gene_type:complete